MKNMKIGKKLILSFSASILASVILVVLAIVSINRVGGLVHDLYNGPFIATTQAMTYSRDIRQLEADLYKALIQKDLTKYETEINAVANDLAARISRVEEVAKGNLKTLDELSKVSSDLASKRVGVVAFMKDGKWEEAERLMRGGYSEALAATSDAVDALYDEATLFAKTWDEQAGNTMTSTIIVQIVVFVVILIIIVILLYKLITSITKPIKELELVAQQISSGHLNNEIEYNSKDELGVLASSFRTTCTVLNDVVQDLTELMNEMADGNFDIRTKQEAAYIGDFNPILMSIRKMNRNLSDTLSQINEAAEQVASGSDQVSSGAQDLSQGATEQASAVQQLAATINEISANTKKSADDALVASEHVAEAGGEIAQSNQRMNEMMEAMAEISQKSNEIGKIIKTIEDIAFQTNILALNAAVEAARAGEAGKGFAVVADEVRNLASKSAEAANNTTHLIEGSITAVEQGTKIAQNTAQALAATVESAKSAVELVKQLGVAAEENAGQISEVTQGVDQISSVVQTNSATSEESAAASEELSGQAQLLKDLVGRFKLRDQGNTVSVPVNNRSKIEIEDDVRPIMPITSVEPVAPVSSSTIDNYSKY